MFLLAAFGAPPQVKQVAHTYKASEVRFWYPTFLKIDGATEFSDRVSIPANSGSDWSYDHLRGARFLCSTEKCAAIENPVFVAWRENESNLVKVVAEAERFGSAIQRAREQSVVVEKYLAEQSCSEAFSGPQKPAFACAEAETQEIATTTCVIRELGAKACEKMGKDAVDIDAPKFFKDAIAREGCGAAVHEITGESYSLLDKTIKKYTAELGITLISEFIGLFSKGAKDAFDWTIAAAKTQACIPSGIELCRTRYATWQESVTQHFAKSLSVNSTLRIRAAACAASERANGDETS
jgi:hypothetical protein